MNQSVDLESAARSLAREHAANKANRIQEVWLFPDESQEEIRLIEISPTAMPSEEYVSAFRFPPHPKSRYPFWIGIAVIRPDEKRRLKLPDDWGVDWTQGKRIWPERSRAVKKASKGNTKR